ncbi:hypothetical protein MNBD_NITROSPIRAE01-374, partial [hydrothermal vent metagenome]
VDGDVVEIDAGLYSADVAVWNANDLTLRGVGGRAHLRADGANAQGKGTWIINGDNVTLENIEFSGAAVPGDNGAGIRHQGGDLTIRYCYFHDNENGILTDSHPSAHILIEYSEFAYNGAGDGYSHNLYIGNIQRFTFQHNYSHHAKNGHNLKSRARENVILYNRIMDESDGTSSYAVDLPDGGLSVVMGNVLQQGPDTGNSSIVSYAAEDAVNPIQALYFVNNTLVNDRGSGSFLQISGNPELRVVNNLFVGGGNTPSGSGVSYNLTMDTDRLVDAPNYNYRLIENSLAENAGIDAGSVAGISLVPTWEYIHSANRKARIVLGVIDIGAYEFSPSDENPNPGSNSVNNLQPGHWLEVPDSKMRTVDPCPDFDCTYSGSAGMAGVVSAWNGGAYDPKRSNLIVWGGGHWDYGGNEIYIFNVNSLKWDRASNPSDPVSIDTAYEPDGQPSSRHTYNYIQYVPSIDRFCSFGGSVLYGTSQAGSSSTDCFNFDPDPTVGGWEQKSSNIDGIGAISAYDSSTGKVWFHHAGNGSFLSEYDPLNDQWTARGTIWTEPGGWFDYYYTAAIDPGRQKMVAIGNGKTIYWDLNQSGDIAFQVLATSGSRAMEDAQAPGFEYDPILDKFVAWSGGASVYTLDFESGVWTEINPAPTNSVVPTAPASRGTNGRFRYMPEKNAYIVYNDADENVFIYKLSEGPGSYPPPN